MKRLGYTLTAAWLLGILIAALGFRAAPEIEQLVTLPITELSFSLVAVLKSFFDAAAPLLMIGVAGALGGVLLRLFKVENAIPSQAEGVAYRFLVGLIVLALVMLVLGLLGAFPAGWVAWGSLLAVSALLWRNLRAWLRDLAAVLSDLLAPTDSALTRWLRVGVLALVVMVGLIALAPATAWDALMYHVAGGRIYLEMGRIGPVADNYRLSLPAFAMMLYTWPQILATGASAAVLNWAAGVALLLIVWGGVKRLSPEALAEGHKPLVFWLACVLILATATLHRQMSIAYADVIATAYAVGAVMLLTARHEGAAQPLARLVLAGVFTGTIMSARVTGFAMTVGIGVLALWVARRGGLAAMVRQAGVVTVVAVLVFSPWIIKNVIVEGNAIAPYGAGGALYPASEAEYERAQFESGEMPLSLVLFLPIQAAFGVEGFAPFQSSYNPVVLGLLPILALYWRHRPEAQRDALAGWLVFSAVVYALWHILAVAVPGFSRLRYVYPLFVLLPLVEAVALVTLPQPAKAINLRGFGMAAAVISLGAGLLLTGAQFITTMPLPVVLGLEPREAYLTRRLTVHYLAMDAVPDRGSTLLLWEPRGLYCLPLCTTDDALNTWDVALETYGDSQEVLAAWREAGYTHVLVHENGARFIIETPGSSLSAADFDSLLALEGDGLLLIYRDAVGAYTLYDITP